MVQVLQFIFNVMIITFALMVITGGFEAVVLLLTPYQLFVSIIIAVILAVVIVAMNTINKGDK